MLHGEDLALIANGVIRPEQLLVIRAAEPAYNPVSNAVEPASCEMLKIQGKPGSWECLFYDAGPKSCTIHAHRPLECRLLQCQETTAILAVTGQDCLNRQDLIAADDPVRPFLLRFADCSWEKIGALLATLSTESVQQAEKILCADLLLREEAITTLQLSLEQEFFYFGRPMFQAWNHPGVQLTFKNGMPHLQLL